MSVPLQSSLPPRRLFGDISPFRAVDRCVEVLDLAIYTASTMVVSYGTSALSQVELAPILKVMFIHGEHTVLT